MKKVLIPNPAPSAMNNSKAAECERKWHNQTESLPCKLRQLFGLHQILRDPSPVDPRRHLPGEAPLEVYHVEPVVLYSARANCAYIYRKPNRFDVLTKAAAILLFITAATSNALAGSATWASFPQDDNWGFPGNWSPATVPGPGDTATFVTSIVHGISISDTTEVASIVFKSGIFGATAFTITANPGQWGLVLFVEGAGITNNSGLTQSFVTVNGSIGAGVIQFNGFASAGISTVFTNNGGTALGPAPGQTQFTVFSTASNGTFINQGASGTALGGSTVFSGDVRAANGIFINNAGAANGGGGHTDFPGGSADNGTFMNNGASDGTAQPGFTKFGNELSDDHSTAANGTFTNNAGTAYGGGGFTEFFAYTTAANGTFINNGASVSTAQPSFTKFYEKSTAASGIFTNNGGTADGAVGGETGFLDNSVAGSATLIAKGGMSGGKGGVVFFEGESFGFASRVKVFGNGNLDVSAHSAPGMTIGSVEGTGNVFLGANNLAVGSNSLSKTFSGVMQDGGRNSGTGGSLTKIGKGKLTLSNANTYTGGTTITQGTLLAKNTTGSATGIGAVQVNAGTFEGIGKVDGAVTVGTGVGTTSRANLLAGNSATSPGTLTINNPVTFQSDSTYKCVLNRGSGTASKLTAFGVNIDSGAKFALLDTGSGTLPTGKVFTVINNISTLPFGGAGAFSNHANGSTFTSNGTNFKVNYKGGTGNDMTLTVVP